MEWMYWAERVRFGDDREELHADGVWVNVLIILRASAEGVRAAPQMPEQAVREPGTFTGSGRCWARGGTS